MRSCAPPLCFTAWCGTAAINLSETNHEIKANTHLCSTAEVQVTRRHTDGAYCVCEMTTMPGDGVSLHVHDRDEEFYYILEATRCRPARNGSRPKRVRWW